MVVWYFITRCSVPEVIGEYSAAACGADDFARFAPTALLHIIPGSIAAFLRP